MSTLWVLGSLAVDDVVPVPRRPGAGETVVADEPVTVQRFGGAGGNQAVAAAAAGAPVRMLARVGADPAGRAYRDRLEGLGVDTQGVVEDPWLPTGRAVVMVDPEGQEAVVVVPGADAGPQEHDVRAALATAEPGDVLLVSLGVPASVVEAAVAAVADADVRVVADLAPFARLPQHVIDRCDPVVVNEREAMALADAGMLPPSLLVTFGERGVSWNGEQIPAHPAASVVDPAGAGDCLVGTLAARLAVGDTDEEALDAALRAAARCVGHEGAQPGGVLGSEREGGGREGGGPGWSPHAAGSEGPQREDEPGGWFAVLGPDDDVRYSGRPPAGTTELDEEIRRLLEGDDPL